MSDREILEAAAAHALRFREGLRERHVGPTATLDELRAGLAVPLTDEGVDGSKVIDDLARAVERGLMAVAGPRFFGFVMGGSTPTSVAADWLTSAWDQNSGLYADSP